MRFLLAILAAAALLVTPAAALEIEAPEVPESGREWMPENTHSIAEGVGEIFHKAVQALRPDLREAAQVSVGILASVILLSVLRLTSDSMKQTAEIAGTTTVASILFLSTNSMLHLAVNTITEVVEYGKLLLPVMTAALAAQGGITASGSLYAGTMLFVAVLSGMVSHFLVPGIYLFLALYTGSCACGEEMLKRIGDLLKNSMSWLLKTILMIFTSYLGLTGVVTGTTDAAVLKATKVTMASFIPVVGGVLSDASEAVLVSAGVMKNAAGVYGIFAVLALLLNPFLRIAAHYLILKLTAAFCCVIGEGRVPALIEAFASAMGILLGMTGAVCVMVLISTVCFMRGVA